MTTDKPEVGDLADHKTRLLDPRPVAEVSADGKRIRLAIGNVLTEWVPASNYTFTRAGR